MLHIQSKMDDRNYSISAKGGLKSNNAGYTVLGRSEIYNTAYTMQTGKVEFAKCCELIVLSKMQQIPYMKGSISHMLQMPGKTRSYISRIRLDVPCRVLVALTSSSSSSMVQIACNNATWKVPAPKCKWKICTAQNIHKINH